MRPGPHQAAPLLNFVRSGMPPGLTNPVLRISCGILLAFFLVSISFSVSGCNRSAEIGLNPGDFAPDFSLKDLTGRQTSLSSFRGRVVVLNFWASWCGSCLAEMPQLESLYGSLKDKGLVVLAVGSEDSEESLRRFQKQAGLTFPIMVDEAGTVKSRYKVTGYPESFVIDKSGRLVMLIDPGSREPAVRIAGPREWLSPALADQIAVLASRP